MELLAYFLLRPRRIEGLWSKQGGRWRPYEIVRTVTLKQIDLENSTTDLLADRAFLDDAEDCGEDGALVRCLCVTNAKGTRVLVLPDGTGHVKLAALI